MPIPAATVILTRSAQSGLEVFLLKRHKKSSFMSSAFVFPGGKVDPDDGADEVAAVRELFEEAGVLLVDRPLSAEVQSGWRRRLLAGEVTFAKMLEAEGLQPERSRLHAWARWVTPSAEPKRFDARFFLAELPPGQVPSFDDQETVEELWITPEQALVRQAAGSLRLPPPQLRILHELAACGSIAAALAVAATRPAEDPICPRIVAETTGVTILLPWDVDYEQASGDGCAFAATHAYATPPSRFRWDGSAWKASQ